ncbi:DUF927 domain-containing protein [uncultured Azohydromonas sp.]|jgi:Superfamily II helicase and inactivated derivatives|uniref:DUF927 domain-containing protein n=1 Tax=uncultured Azohydromonas sp. TaxID=487342 RepID=UPI002633BCE3|nr:DUF927 domain-containing protein [uncultured Azohydromonas sp.]
MTQAHYPKGQRGPAAPRVITPELVRSALLCIPPDVDRETWVRLAMACKSELDGAGFDLWDEWSRSGTDYNQADARDTWRSIKAGGRVRIGTLFAIAKGHGFRFPEGDGAAPAPDPVALQRAAEEKQRQREAEEARRRALADKVAQKAARLWEHASEQGSSAYLQRKGVQAHGVRFMRDGTLLVPMRNEAGELQNLQQIAPTKPTEEEHAAGQREKRYLYGGRKAGLWHLVGDPQGAALLVLAEGYATASTVHEVAGHPVAVAFDSGNLPEVAKALRRLYPAARLLVAGDDDKATEERTGKNPGRIKARAAARAAGGLAFFPEGLPEGGSDFNDLAQHAGPGAVLALVERAAGELLALPLSPGAEDAPATEPGTDAVTEAQEAPQQAPRKRAKGKGAAAPDGSASASPAAAGGSGDGEGDGGKRRPRDPFHVDEQGVWHVARDNDGNEKPPQWLCEPLHVTAITRDETDNGYGYLLEFKNRDGNPRTWAAPAALFGGESNEWAARLRDMGLRTATGVRARNLLGQYIDSRNPAARVTCTDRVGWHGPVYVLPSRCIGSSEGKRYVFQSESGMEDTFRRRGTLEAWQAGVSARCAGNSRLVFSLSCALAGPLVGPLQVQTGGFHLVGDSSLGKTTALLAAASVWGSPKFKQQWRTTDNGLESVAVQHSDCLLILDEIGQMDGRVVGDCAYMLGNEAEKIRGSRGPLPRKRRTWRLLFLSSGEKTLADHMQEAGKKPNEGQLVRMPSVPADAGAGLGMFQELHGVAAGAGAGKAFAEAITSASAAAYGVAGAAWLEWLAANMGEATELGQSLMRRMEADWVPAHSHAQVWCVASRFALVGAAGELATHAGVTGWEPGEAENAARECFMAWLRTRGHAGNGETAAMLRQVRAFLEKNGDALFTWTHRAMDDRRANTPLRAGFRRLVDEEGKPLRIDAAAEYMDAVSTPESSPARDALVEYLVFPEAFRRDVCKGFDPQAVARLLQQRGHLVHEKDRLTVKHRLPGMSKAPCYHVKPSIFEDDL